MEPNSLPQKAKVIKGSSISESQEEGTIIANARTEEMFIGNGDFGEHDRNDINIEGITRAFFYL